MNIIQQFVKSIYSPATIAKFRFQKIGKVILYVFFLMFIATLPPAITIGTSFSDFFNKTETHLVNTFPDFAIENGVLVSDINETIIENEDGEVIIFDPTGELTPTDISEYDVAFALLERQAVLNADGMQESFVYQELGIDFTKSEAVELVESIGGIIPLLIGIFIVFMYLFATGMKFIGIFSLSVLGIIMNKKSNSLSSYKQIWVLAAYTVTLPTILLAITDTLRIVIPFSFTLYWVIAFLLLLKVFKELPQQKQP